MYQMKAGPLGPSVRTDVLKGAANIAVFLFGSAARRREVYYLVHAGSLPVFRLGAMICARRSTLASWISQQEAAATHGEAV